MKKLFLTLVAATLLIGANTIKAQDTSIAGKEISQAKNDSEKYLLTYYPMAVEQMEKYGIPASITLAQGLLESGAGKSKLATEANNHFGIKADKRWNGQTMSSYDNGNWHKFRKYDNPGMSYEDHSKFLAGSNRYAALFKLDRTDYKGWAKGLKDAYYAEDREYDTKLITLIEKYGLHEFDTMLEQESGESGINKVVADRLGKREVMYANGLKYVLAKDGDTFQSLSKELGISKYRIRKCNDLYKEYVFKEGDIVYLEKKNNKATPGYEFHTTRRGESLHRISQIYGIKFVKIYELNPHFKTSNLKVGDSVRLR